MGVRQLSGNEMLIDNTMGTLWLPAIAILLFLFSIGLLFFPQVIGGTGNLTLTGIIVFGISIICILLWANAWIRIKISKSFGVVEIKKILKSETCKIAQIAKVELVQERSTSKTKGRARIIQYFLLFLLENNERLKFQDITKSQQEARKVAEFLGVPFEYRPLPSYGEAASMTMDVLKNRMEQAQQEYGKKQEEESR